MDNRDREIKLEDIDEVRKEMYQRQKTMPCRCSASLAPLECYKIHEEVANVNSPDYIAALAKIKQCKKKKEKELNLSGYSEPTLPPEICK